MLRSKHLVGLILVATLMATLIPSLTAVYAESQDKQQEKAEAFVAVAEEAKNEVDELMSTIGEEGVPPELNTLYEEGVGNLMAAQEELGKEDPEYELVISLAKEAMKIFRNVYGQLNTLLEGEEAGEETEEETEEGEEAEEIEEPEDPQTLMQAIERARRRIDRVNGTIDANIGYLTEYAEETLRGEDGLLVNATELLDEAEAALGQDPPDVSTAAKKHGDAHKLISQAFVILKKAAGALNNGRINGFLTVISKFYERVARWVEREGCAEEFGDDLEYIWGLIDGVHTQDQETQFADIVADLMEARIRLESIQNEIRGKSE